MRSLAPVALIPCLLAFLVPVSASAADGPALYATHCAKCHGEDGKSDTPVGKAMKAADLSDPKWAAEGAAEALVSGFHGTPKHKSLAGKVTDDDLRAIAEHVRKLASAGE